MTTQYNATLHRLALLIVLFACALTGLAGEENRLKLKSDSVDGVWRFYAAEKHPKYLSRVLLIGDSIMNGYHGGVTEQIKHHATVDFWLTPITLKSPEMYDDLREVLKQGPYEVIHFNIGLHEWQKGFIPDGQYEPLLRAYVKVIQENAADAKLIWASTTQMTVQDKPAEVDPENNPTITERNAIAAKVMKELGIEVDDLYTLMSDKLALAKGDKFHWSPQGVAVQAAAVAKIVSEQLDQRILPRPPGINYDEAQVAAYTLPPLLKTNDGTPITSSADWTAKRRPEILELYCEHVYGHTPGLGSAKFEITAEKKDALGGLATRKIIHASLPKFPQWQGMDIMLYVPNGLAKPAPVFFGLNFDGNHAVTNEADIPLTTRWMRDNKAKGIVDHHATEASRGIESEYWQAELIVKNGFALATAYYGDLEPDHPQGWKDGLRAAVSPDGANTQWKSGAWGAIGVWAWGYSRILDYCETDKSVDAAHAASVGHSRLGKTSLWAGAQDPRISIVISNNSGEGGAALMRRNFGETTRTMTHGYPHWFAPRYASYGDHAADCPVDQHMLIALMAPRPVYIASAVDDKWADPKGEFLSGKIAGEVYALFGKKGVGVEKRPELNHPVGDCVGYHMRSGRHYMTAYDWEQYTKFATRHFGK